jgi:uncharacterized membrane-anchored protein YhcB (DUF1043 family)
MYCKALTIFSFLVLTATVFGQNNTKTIEDQFTDVIDKSNSYQEFKVIPKSKISILRKNILDSIAALEEQVANGQTELMQQKTEISNLTASLNTTRQNLTASKEKEDGIELFGNITKKSTYNTIMWSIISGLLIILGFLFFKYKNSHAVTRATQTKLSEVEHEFDAYRKKALEENQLIGRKLQDEINKNRNV